MKASLFIVPAPWRGRLAIAPRPRGGDWLDDEIHGLREGGVDVLVSALTAGEVAELGLQYEARISEEQGIEFIHFPIEDRGVPASKDAVAELVRRMRDALESGKTVALHCRSAIGRSSLLAASLLVSGGIAPEKAFQVIEDARGLAVPDTSEQRSWVERFAKEGLVAARRAAS